MDDHSTVPLSHTWVCTLTHMLMLTHTHRNISCTLTHSRVHSRTRIFMDTHVHTQAHSCTHAHTHTHRHMHSHGHTHAHPALAAPVQDLQPCPAGFSVLFFTFGKAGPLPSPLGRGPEQTRPEEPSFLLLAPSAFQTEMEVRNGPPPGQGWLSDLPRGPEEPPHLGSDADGRGPRTEVPRRELPRAANLQIKLWDSCRAPSSPCPSLPLPPPHIVCMSLSDPLVLSCSLSVPPHPCGYHCMAARWQLHLQTSRPHSRHEDKAEGILIDASRHFPRHV